MDSELSGENYFANDSLNIPPIELQQSTCNNNNEMEVDSPLKSDLEESSSTKNLVVPVIIMDSTSDSIGMKRNDSNDSNVEVKKEDDEMIVDIMGLNGDESIPEDYQPLRLQPLARSTTQPKPKKRPGRPSKAVYSTSPLATSLDNSPAGSPGPSNLSNLLKGSGNLDEDDSELDPDSPATTSHLKSEGSGLGLASTSTLSPDGGIGEDNIQSGILGNGLDRFEHLKPTLLPQNIRLSSPFASYTPPQGGSDTDDDGDNVGEEGGEKVRRKGKGRVKEIDLFVEEEGDDRLYCVCRLLYDPERMMIACDLCEKWYHLDCIEISDIKVELVDQFVCPLCHTRKYLSSSRSRSYSEQRCLCSTASTHTTYKAQCARPTCPKPVAPISKYCSDYCGIEVAATRLELAGYEPERFWSKVVGARRREGVVIDVSEGNLGSEKENLNEMEGVEENGIEKEKKIELPNYLAEEVIKKETEESLRTLLSLHSKLGEMSTRRTILDNKLSFINARLHYLSIAIRRWETICQATVDGIASAEAAIELAELEAGITSSSKSNNKKSTGGKKSLPVIATMSPHAQCGLDVRLVYDDAQWESWVRSPEGRAILERAEGDELIGMEEGGDLEGVCLRPKKKCERHTGWQKVREADFEVEKQVLTRRLDKLYSQIIRTRDHIIDHEEVTKFRVQNQKKTGVALDVTNQMAIHNPSPRNPARSSPSSSKRRVGGSAGGSLVNGHAVNLASIIPSSAPVTSTTSMTIPTNFNQNASSSSAMARDGSAQSIGGDGMGSSRGGSVGIGGGAEEVEGDHYDIPDEVFAFLSRSEQQKLRGSRR